MHQSYGIVKVYEAATTLINQHPLENGKTMGLSSYGDINDYYSLFINEKVISDYFSSIDICILSSSRITLQFWSPNYLKDNNDSLVN